MKLFCSFFGIFTATTTLRLMVDKCRCKRGYYQRTLELIQIKAMRCGMRLCTVLGTGDRMDKEGVR